MTAVVVCYPAAMRLTCLLIVVAFAMSSTQLGCSFAFVKGPPSPKEPLGYTSEEGFSCTETKAAPIADVVLASTGGMASFAILGTLTGTPPQDQTAQQRQDGNTARGYVFFGGLVVAAVGTAAAIWGFHTVRKCREYIDSPSTRRGLLHLREKALQAEAGGDQASSIPTPP